MQIMINANYERWSTFNIPLSSATDTRVECIFSVVGFLILVGQGRGVRRMYVVLMYYSYY